MPLHTPYHNHYPKPQKQNPRKDVIILSSKGLRTSSACNNKKYFSLDLWELFLSALTGDIFVVALHPEIFGMAAESVFNWHKAALNQPSLPTAAIDVPHPYGLLHAGFRHGIWARDHAYGAVVTDPLASHSAMTTHAIRTTASMSCST